MLHQPFTVLVTGPESSGKTTLARQLAWALDGQYVPEVARAYLATTGGSYGPEDLPSIWQQQQQAELEARESGASLVICDTGPEVIKIWEEVKFGNVSAEVNQGFHRHHYDLTLLCYPDIPWEPDPLREAPDQRERLNLLRRYQDLLRGRGYHAIEGTPRLARALRIIHENL